MSRISTFSIEQTKAWLRLKIASWREERDRDRAVPFILGETGNGKTQLIQQVAREEKMGYIELNLGNALDPTELTGCRIPVADPNGNYTLKLALLDEIAVMVADTKNDFILFIDELGAEQPQMRNFLLKLFAEKKINGVSVANAFLVCAGNPPGTYKTTPLEPALRARVELAWTEAKSAEVANYFDNKAATKFATNKDLQTAYGIVANFIRMHNDRFGQQDGKTPDMNNPIRCARAYEFAIDPIYTYGIKNKETEFLRTSLVGILGVETGRELAEFVKKGATGIFSPDDILQGRFSDPHDPAKWFIIVENTFLHVSSNIKVADKNMIENIAKFIAFGPKDKVNGIIRKLDENFYKLNERTVGSLMAKLESLGVGTTAMVEEQGVAVDDAIPVAAGAAPMAAPGTTTKKAPAAKAKP